jgi:diaminopimelate decarboxylase
VVANQLAPDWLSVPGDLNALDARVWPDATQRRESGELEFAGVPASELAAQFGTPLYVVNEDSFRARARHAKAVIERLAAAHGTTAKVYYASKALLTAEVASWIAADGLNIDVASGGELTAALVGGVPAGRIGLHGNNKSLREIGRAITEGVGALVVDSEIEIERIAAAAGAADRIQAVRLRINTGVHANTHDFLATAREDQKFGIPIKDAPALVAKIRAERHLRFIGLHQHVGSQIFSPEGFVESSKRLLQLHAELLAGGEIPELNLGGGFGINYKPADRAPELEDFVAPIIAAVAEEAKRLGIALPALAFEPGRYIAGNSGVTLYNIGTIKDVLVTDGAEPAVRKYVSIDGGMSDNARPALYEAEYHAVLAGRSSSAPAALARVVGKHCESGDIVVRHDYLPADVAPNDLLAVAATGAYCYSLSSNYNYLTRPAMVAVSSGTARLIVRGETEADMFSRDLTYQARVNSAAAGNGN